MLKMNDNGIINQYITKAKYERTAICKTRLQDREAHHHQRCTRGQTPNQIQTRANTARQDSGLCLGHHSTQASTQVHT